MNTKLLLGVMGAAILCAGCVQTVTGRTKAGVPFVKDVVFGHYERPVDQVFEASKEVVKFNGTLVNESIIHTETNLVKTVEGKVNQRSVFIRVEAMDPKITTLAVEARTKGGSGDVDLAHELEKQIALKLVK